MKRLLSKRGRDSDTLRSFYFHLDALETSVVHPKYVSEQLKISLHLTEDDMDYAFSLIEFVDHCAGKGGAPTNTGRRTAALEALRGLHHSIPTSQVDYRFCRHEIGELESVITSMGD